MPIELVIGAGNSMIEWWLMPRLGALRTALPRTKITLINVRTADAIQRLRDMTIDLGIVRCDAVTNPLLKRPLLKLPYSLFLPEKLASGVTIQNIAKKLSGISIATSIGGQFREQLDAAALKAGVNLNLDIICSSFTQAARVVSNGTAAAILPDIAAADFPGGSVKAIPLSFLRSYERRLCLAWHKRRVDSNTSIDKAVAMLSVN